MKNFFTSSPDPTPSDTFDAQIDALKAGESVYLQGVDSVRYMELYEKYKKERNGGKLRFVRDSRPTELDVFNTEKVEKVEDVFVPPKVVEVVEVEPQEWGPANLDLPAEDCKTPEDCEDGCEGNCPEAFEGDNLT
jgi:aryl carrier-like protein